MEATYNIPSKNLAAFKSALEKQAKKAVKLGMPKIGFTDNGLKHVTKNGYEYVAHNITVFGERPVISGWEFIGVLTHEKGMPDPLLHSVSPKNKIPDQYKHCDPNCDHCHTNRMRNKTFIVKKEEGDEYKQIGSGCISDFFGGKDPHNIASYAELLAITQHLCWNIANDLDHLNSNIPDYIGVKNVLDHTSAIISNFGYLSYHDAQAEGELSTVDRIKNIFFSGELAVNSHKVYPEDKDKADQVMQWILSDEFKEESNTSEYLHNIRTLTEFGKVGKSDIGLLASSIQAYDRHIENIRFQERKAQSEFVGNIKDKIEHVEVTLLGTRYFETNFGHKILYKFVDKNNNSVNWFNTGHPLHIKKGEKVHIKGTIEEHKLYKDEKQTFLKRVTCHEDKIFIAIERNDVNSLKKLLKMPSNLSIHDNNGALTPLMLACRNGNIECVDLLLDAGSNPNESITDGHAGFFAVYPTKNSDRAQEDIAIEILARLIKHSPNLLTTPRRLDEKVITDLCSDRLKAGIENILLEQSIQLDEPDYSPSFSF